MAVEVGVIYVTLLELSILITMAEFVSLILSKYGYPRVISELLVGLALSPYAIGGVLNDLLHIDIFTVNSYVYFLSEFSVILLLFASGLEHGLSTLRAGGVLGLLAAIAGAVVPYYLVYEVLEIMHFNNAQASLIALSTGPTSLAVVAGIIEGEGFINLKSTKILVTSASLDDVVTLIMLSAITSMLGGSREPIVVTVIRIIGLWALVLALSILIIPRVLDRINELLVVYASLIVLFGLTTLMTALGFSAVIASFIAGVAVAESARSGRVKGAVDELLAIFGSIFFIAFGLQVDVRYMFNLGALTSALIVSSIAIAGKVIGVYPFAYAKLRNGGQALTASLGMVPRGEMGIAVASIGYSNGLIGQDGLAIVVLMVLITTVAGALAYKRSAIKYG